MFPLAHCPACGYSLEGLPLVGQCPECGKYYDDQTIVLYVREPRLVRLMFRISLPIFGLVSAVMFLSWRRNPSGWTLFNFIEPVTLLGLYGFHVFRNSKRLRGRNGQTQLRLSAAGFAIRQGVGAVVIKPWKLGMRHRITAVYEGRFHIVVSRVFWESRIDVELESTLPSMKYLENLLDIWLPHARFPVLPSPTTRANGYNPPG